MPKIVVIAIKHPTEPNLYLHGLRSNNQKWALPGGHSNPGETDHEAAQRELEEESGLKDIKLDKIHDKVYDSNHVVLFTAMNPLNTALNSENDPDKEFTTFKFLDPTTHSHLHVPKKDNILVHWMQGKPEEPKKSNKTPLHWSSGYLAHKSQSLNKSEDLEKAKLTKYPSIVSPRQLGKIWHFHAYGDWSDAPVRDNIDNYDDTTADDMDDYQNMVDNHHDSNWKLTTIPTSIISGHHSGHDASKEYIQDYTNQIKMGSNPPPLIVKPHPEKPDHYITVDGQHRLEAARMAGLSHIQAYVPDTTLTKSENLTKNEPYSGGTAKQTGYSTHGEWKPMSVMHHLEAGERGNSWHVPAHMMNTHEALWVTHKKTSRYGNQYQVDLTGAVPVMSDGEAGHLYARPKQNTHKSDADSIPLVHYSATSGLKAIDPNFMGTGTRSQENKRGSPEIKRSFFYKAGTKPESLVTQNSPHQYHLTLHPTHKIYDLSKDPDKLIEQAVQHNQGAYNSDKVLGAIKNAGYQGYHASESSMPNVIALFHSHPIDREG